MTDCVEMLKELLLEIDALDNPKKNVKRRSTELSRNRKRQSVARSKSEPINLDDFMEYEMLQLVQLIQLLPC
jgi:hypothetical protein